MTAIADNPSTDDLMSVSGGKEGNTRTAGKMTHLTRRTLIRAGRCSRGVSPLFVLNLSVCLSVSEVVRKTVTIFTLQLTCGT